MIRHGNGTGDGRREGGFTLVELMVALFVGAIVIWGIYAIFSTSQNIFHREQKIGQSQLGVRLGIELMKNDIKRAGYMMSPNSDVDPLVCRNQGLTGVRLHPVRHFNGEAGKVWKKDGTNTEKVSIFKATDYNKNIAPDALLLTGNYVSTMSYLAENIVAGSGSIRLQRLQGRPLPGQDIVDGSTTPPDENADAEFTRLFPLNSFVRVVNKSGYMMFSKITAVSSASDRTVTVDPLFDASEQNIRCGIEGYGEGSEVNVVNAVLYRVELDPSPDADDNQNDRGQKMDLVRYQTDADGVPIAATREVIVEYVVDFQVWYRMDNPNGATPGRPNVGYTTDYPGDGTIVIGIDPSASPPPLDGSVNAHPENMRAAIVMLSVRTDKEDPAFPFISRVAGQPLMRFELNETLAGAAHVRTVFSQVELPNIAYRNLRN